VSGDLTKSGGDAAVDPRGAGGSSKEKAADTVATPEGDNEFAPDQPLKPVQSVLQKTPAIDTNKT